MVQQTKQVTIRTVGEAQTFLDHVPALRFGDTEQLAALEIVRDARELEELRNAAPGGLLGMGNVPIFLLEIEFLREELSARRAVASGRHGGE